MIVSKNPIAVSPSRQDFYWLLALALAAIAWYAWPLLSPNFLGWDGDRLCLFLPAMRLAREELFAGRVPLWNPYKFLGVPLLADQMVPFFYPPQTLALLAPQPWGLDAMLVAHYALAAAGTYLLARRGMDCSPAGSILAATTFAFSAPLVAAVAHPNQLCATTWLPLVWLVALGLFGDATPVRKILCFALALALQTLAGQPQIVVYGAILIGWTLIIDACMARRDRAALLNAAIAAAAALALAVGLTAIHWLPAMELDRLSGRRLLPDQFAGSFSLPPQNLATLLFPDAFGSPASGGYRGESNFTEAAIYIGQVSLLLAMIGFVVRRRDRRAWIAGLSAISALLLALGKSTPVLKILTILVPTIGHFRAPARAWTIAALALAVAAGWGLDAISAAMTRHGGARAARALIVLLIGLQLIGAAWFRFYLMSPAFTSIDVLQTPTLESLLRREDPNPGRIFRLNDQIDYNDASRDAIIQKFSILQPDLNALSGLRDWTGYGEGLLPTSPYLQFEEHFRYNLYSPNPDSKLLGLMGVEFLFSDKPIIGDRWRPFGKWKNIDLFRNLDYRAEVSTRGDWPEIDFRAVSGDFPIVAPPTGPFATLLASPAAAGAPPKIQSYRIAPGELRVRLPEHWKGELLFSEGWMPGWRAVSPEGLVDARKINAAVMAFDLPAGGEWTLRYDPASFRLGSAASALALVAVLLLVLFAYRNRRSLP